MGREQPSDPWLLSFHRGNGDGMPAQEEARNTGDSRRWVRDPTGHPRGIGRAAGGVGEAHSTRETANPGGGKGPHFKVNV